MTRPCMQHSHTCALYEATRHKRPVAPDPARAGSHDGNARTSLLNCRAAGDPSSAVRSFFDRPDKLGARLPMPIARRGGAGSPRARSRLNLRPLDDLRQDHAEPAQALIPTPSIRPFVSGLHVSENGEDGCVKTRRITERI